MSPKSLSMTGRTLALPLCLLAVSLGATCGESGSGPGTPGAAGTSSTGAAGTSATGAAGTSSTGAAGTSSTGAAGTSSTGAAGTSSTGAAGTSTTGAAGTGAAGTSVVGTGAAGTSVAGTGAAGTVGAGAGTSGSTSAYTPCNTAPAATVPALKRGPAITGIVGQAGQMVGVPGENVIYVISHKMGNIHTIQNGTLAATPLAHVDVATGGNNEQGLLSMALHPNFATNGLFYLFYTAAGAGAMTVDEFKRLTPTTSMFTQNIHSKPRAGGGMFHNGGAITFNPKDTTPFLYFSVGNNESNQAGMPMGDAGRVLRIDVSNKSSITYAYGFRNPYRMSIDRLTGDMFIADVANGSGGTIIFHPNGSAPGKDFLYRNNNGNPDVNNGILRDGAGGAIIGGHVYRGNKIAGLCGRYFYGNWDNGAVKSVVVQNGAVMGAPTTHTTLTVPGQVTSFGEDGEGELWMASQGMNAIYKIEAGP